MLKLAWRTLKGRKSGFVGAFIALFCASALITGCGILLQSGLSSGVSPERYADAPLVVGAHQALEKAEVPDIAYGDRVRLPSTMVEEIAAIPGVASAVGDTSFPVTLARNGETLGGKQQSLFGHGWDSAKLGPFNLVSGHAPVTTQDVVLDEQLAQQTGLNVGDQIQVAVGSIPADSRVTGIAKHAVDTDLRQHAVFFIPQQAKQLANHADQVDAIGVLPSPGVNTAELATNINTALAGRGVQVFAGESRGEIEFLDVSQAKGTLVAVAGSFGGVALVVALFIVASTMALQIQQRRREFALLRAIAATPKQLHRLIATESLVVSMLAAILGLIPGLLLSFVLRDAFAAIGLVPGDFQLVTNPIPMLIAAVLCVLAGRVAGWLSARKVARIRPVEALDATAMQSPKLGLARSLIGLLLLIAGLGLSMLPLVVSGDAATGAAAISVIVLVIAVALLGPRLAALAIALLGPFLRRGGTSGFLAAANTRSNSRRLASAIIPLVLAIAVASVQLFTGTTKSSIAEDQVARGVIADFVVNNPQSGLAPAIADGLDKVDGVSTVTPVVRAQILGDYFPPGATKPATKTFSAQGITPEGLSSTINLDTRAGSLDELQNNTVALSQTGADVFGAHLGDKIQLYLGDGTTINPSVVAIYGNGLGFGDVTLPRDVLGQHTSTGLDDLILIRGESAANITEVKQEISKSLQQYLGVSVQDGTTFAAAQQQQLEMQGFATMLLLAAVFGYIAIGVANTLVMATAERRREFALLRLVGADRKHVNTMMRTESLVVIIVSWIIGSLLAIPPLVGVSLGLSERHDAIPAVSLPIYAGILLVTAAIAILSIVVPTKLAMRMRPVDAIGTRE